MKFAVLNQRNPAYRADVWEEIEKLYEGGYAVTKESKRFLPKMADEHESVWEMRRKTTGYLGYLGQMIDEFVGALFEGGLTVAEPADATKPGTPGGVADSDFYGAFAIDADLAGTPFSQVMASAMRTALQKQRAIIAIDFPTSPEAAVVTTRAEEDALGTSRAYLFEIDPAQLVDWKLDRWGNFEWAILYRIVKERAAPETDREGSVRHEFKIWRRAAGPVATWEVWSYTEDKDHPKVEDDTDFTLMTPVTQTTFEQIPLFLCELPHGLWVGNKVGSLQTEHHRRRSCLVAAMGKSLIAIPYVKLGSEIGSGGGPMPAEIAMNPNRGNDPIGQFNRKGFIALGSEDEVGFAEPAGSSYQVTREDLRELKDEMFRVVHQMAAAITATKSQAGASGDSKREDRTSEAIVLEGLGALVREWAKKIYTAISTARKESVAWSVHGLDDFESEDRGAILAEATQLDTINIPSPTWKKHHKTRVAFKLLPDATHEERTAIKQEIEAGVDDEQAMAKERRETEKVTLVATREDPLGAKKPAPPTK